MKVCGHPQDAEDTMQDVLLKSLPYLPKFENAQALSVWLYKVARNRCLMSRRGAKFSSKLNLSLDALMPDGRELRELLESHDPNPESTAMSQQSGERLHQAILKLPPQYRFVLVLHDMEGLGAAEVGKVLGLREGTVRVRLHRARLQVRRQLSRIEQSGRHPEKTIPKAQKSRRCRELFAALSDYMDGVIDDAVCQDMQMHIHDCEPCQVFLHSLESVVKQCRSYRPPCDLPDKGKLAKDLLQQYQAAQLALARKAAKVN